MPHLRSPLSSALMTAGEPASHQRRRWVAIVAIGIVTIEAMVAIVAIVASVAIVAWVAIVAIGGHCGLGCGLVS